MTFILILFSMITFVHAGTARLIESTVYATKHTTTPSNPSSGKNKIYTKSDDKVYVLTSAGSESALQVAGNYITALTGDVTASGPGSSAATIANLAVTNAKIANSTIDLTTKVTGINPVPNGGTGAATLTVNNVLLGNGTSAVQFVAPGTSGNVLTSNGTTWTSAASAAGTYKICAFSVNTSSDVASNVKFSCLNSTTCTDGTANQANCTFATSFFTTTPICTCTEHSGNSRWCNLTTVSATNVTVRGVVHDGSGDNISPDVICTGE